LGIYHAFVSISLERTQAAVPSGAGRTGFKWGKGDVEAGFSRNGGRMSFMTCCAI